MKQFILNHLMISEFVLLITLLIASIVYGFLPFVLFMVAILTLWIWWIVSMLIHDVREELHKRH